MTTHHRLSTGSTSTTNAPRIGLQDHTLSWTDDLPVCHLSGVGFSTNQIYREDGFRKEEHEFEDKSFHFRMDNTCQLYAVFDGHNGIRASNFAAQRMPAELLLGQLDEAGSDDQIKEALHQAFIAVEKGFFESIDELLAERTNLIMQLPEGINEYDAYNKYPDIINKLRELDMEICSGTAAVVVLICNNKLYVANIGNSRALLCKTDEEGVLRVNKLSVDHTLSNEDELLRLSQLGLPVEQVKNCNKLGHQVYTRCIGDYSVKGGYKDIENLSSAISEPVIAEPDICGGIEIDNSCSFLILMSDGCYKALEDATNTEHVNADIASMVATEFGAQTTLNGVSQAVIDKIVRKHHDTFMTGDHVTKQLCEKRDDMTLLVRNFNYPLPNVVGSPTTNAYVTNTTKSVFLNRVLFQAKQQRSGEGTLRNTTHSSTLQYSSGTYSNSNDSLEDQRSLLSRNRSIRTPLELDEEGKVAPYVDFSEFYKALAELTESQRETLDKDTEPPPPVIDTIAEEDEQKKDNENEINSGDSSSSDSRAEDNEDNIDPDRETDL